ncbi:MAG: zf-HC2 domain-containing protein [Elusimicrobiota bacterium]|nr:zf-HC2 domain-containing protein [Elusimicrobiota bacterium]
MECKKCFSLLCEYKDGELDATAATAVKRHLDGCSACSAELDSMKNIAGIIASVKAPKAPDDFEDHVIGEVMRKRRQKSSFRFLLQDAWFPVFSFIRLPRLRLAALALLVAGGVFFAVKNSSTKNYYSDLLISDAELSDLDSEIMNIFYGEI